MTTLTQVNPSLFAEIQDTDAQTVQGGSNGSSLPINIDISKCGISICYDFCFPGLKVSGSFFYKFYNPGKSNG